MPRVAKKTVARAKPAERAVKVKRLYRSRTNKILCGVCGGIAEYVDVDPTIIRLLWIIGTVLTGIFVGVLAYIAACLVIPKKPE
ncbi:MAG: PspC domain-containing protein [Candidatus Micrarchaeota archaeon]